jgi:hypothetical protein
MSSDDRRSEQFIREVDEELRRAQLKSIWDRFGPLIIGVCVLVVVVTAGYRGWIWWEARQAAQTGDRYIAALDTLGTDRAAGQAELERFAGETGAGYAALAKLRMAGEKAAAGDKAGALAGFDAVANDSSAAQSLRDLARIRAAMLALDAGDVEGAKSRAEPLNAPGNAWRHLAREVLGTAAYRGGQLEEARDAFTAIQQDAETPPDLWVRAGMMVSLIDGELAAPGSPEATNTPAPSAPAPAAPVEAPVPQSGPAGNFDAPAETPPAANPPTEPPASPSVPEPAAPAAAPTQAPAPPPAAPAPTPEPAPAAPAPTPTPAPAPPTAAPAPAAPPAPAPIPPQ